MSWALAGGMAGASILGGAMNQQAQSNANEMQRANMFAQHDFEAYQSNTAYRRGMYDLKEAGLNPMLAYSQGGASASKGSMAGAQAETGLGEGVQQGLSTAMELKGLKADMKLKDQQTKTTKKLGTAHQASALKNVMESNALNKRMGAITQESHFKEGLYKGGKQILNKTVEGYEAGAKEIDRLFKQLMD